jgi:flagellar biosynthesis/type III secretory pathway M-ring protein FliF/YscJ
MIMVQAVPPVPPVPPFDPNLLLMNADSPAVVMIVLAALAAATIVLWPIARALARRLEGRGGADPALRGEVEQLHQRLGEVDALHARIGELEDRLDFAERLLAQTREPDRLQR